MKAILRSKGIVSTTCTEFISEHLLEISWLYKFTFTLTVAMSDLGGSLQTKICLTLTSLSTY